MPMNDSANDLPDPTAGFDTDHTALSDDAIDTLEQPLDDVMEERDEQGFGGHRW